MILTTITEVSAIHEISNQQLAKSIKNQRIKPLKDTRVTINGFIGNPYKLSDLQDIITKFKEKKSKVKNNKFLKKYTTEQICVILRKNPKHYLWNKQVTKWTIYDWKEFEKIEKL